MKINLFKAGNNSSKPYSEIEFENYLSNIKNGLWQDDVLAYRTGNFDKQKLPCITTSGIFSERKEDKLLHHSGFMCIDLDAKDQVVSFDIEAIKKDAYVYALHQSVGGFGYAVFFKINPEKHKESYLGLEKYFLDNYKLIVDPAPKNVCSLRYVSYDPHLYQNDKAKTFKNYIKKEIKKDTFTYYPTTENDFDEIVREYTSRYLNLCDDYQTWVNFSFALADGFGINGRNYYHAFSCTSAKYTRESTDKMYDIALKRQKSGITIKTIYYHCKQAGINIVSEKTKQITNITKLSSTKEEAKIKLKELGIEDGGLVDKIKNENKERTTLDEVVDMIKISNIKFNEITRNYEFGKDQMSDRVLAKFYTKCWNLIDEDLSKDKIFTLIENPDNTISFNPIKQFFAKNEHLKPTGIFDALCSCFEIEHNILFDGKILKVDDYLQIFLKKWLLSIIGSAHGTYSLMILVLNGKQGISKTEFFRNLLPAELREYYAESNLDEGKDSEILMTKKLLIVDDEFGGKSKKDATKLKRLSSQQTFSIRRPYGKVSEDLNRLAVLGGTSNESEVINDPTGNRRIIPINLVNFNLVKYRAIDKTELFMELYHEWQKDRTGWFLTTDEIDGLNQSTLINQEIMTEEELILDCVIKDDYTDMTNTQIKLKLEIKYPSFRTTTKRIGLALKKCGFEPIIKMIDGKTQRVYKVKFKNDNITDHF
jgi:hypothetical protein